MRTRTHEASMKRLPKDIPLEALRGVASLVVVVAHVCGGFFPLSGGADRGTPLFVFMNGRAAIQLFFVLSAYVLTRRYFELGDNRILLNSDLRKSLAAFAGPHYVFVVRLGHRGDEHANVVAIVVLERLVDLPPVGRRWGRTGRYGIAPCQKGAGRARLSLFAKR